MSRTRKTKEDKGNRSKSALSEISVHYLTKKPNYIAFISGKGK
jgi:hypothetical protein